MSTFAKAVAIAVKAHEGQVDLQGQPYITHPLRVASSFYQRLHEAFGDNKEMEALAIVGILHDVIEDTEVTALDLKREGFSEIIINALGALTHCKDESYTHYVMRVKLDPIATQVKLKDLKDNSDLDRLIFSPQNREKDLKRVQKYALSYMFLTEKIDFKTYEDAITNLYRKA